MSTSLLTGSVTFLAAALVLLSAVQSTVADADPASFACYSDWTGASQVVEREALVSVEKLSRQFQRQNLGTIVKTTLCEKNGTYVYRLVVKARDGRLRTTIFDARLGIEVGLAEQAH